MNTLPGLRSATLAFDGDGRVELHHIVLGESFTIEAWILPTSTEGQHGILSFLNLPGEELSIWVAEGGRLRASVPLEDSRPCELETDPIVREGEWSHVALSSDGSSVRIIVDGVVKAQSPVANLPGGWDTAMTIGAAHTHFVGSLAEIRLWSIPRKAEEVRDDMATALEGNEPGLFAYWPLSEGSGTIVGDYTGNGHAGEVVKTRWTLKVPPPPIIPVAHLDPHLALVEFESRDFTFVSGWAHREANVVGGGPDLCLEHAQYLDWRPESTDWRCGFSFVRPVVDFNGVNDVARVDGELDLSAPAWTVEMWVRLRYPSLHGKGVLLSQGDSAQGFALLVTDDGRLELWRFSGGQATTWRSEPKVVGESKWEHVCLTGKDDVVRLWQPSSERAAEGKRFSPDKSTSLILPRSSAALVGHGNLSSSPAPLYIGGDPNPGSERGEFLHCQLSELRIWATCRVPDDINEYRYERIASRHRNNGASRDLVAAWHLTPARRRRATCWFAASAAGPVDRSEAAPILALESTTLDGVELADVPLQAVVREAALYLFRQTTEHHLIVDQFQYDRTSETLVRRPGTHTRKLDIGLALYRGWFAVDHDGSNWYVVHCGMNAAGSTERDRIGVIRFTEDSNGEFTQRFDLGVTEPTHDRQGVQFIGAPAAKVAGPGSDRRLVLTVPTKAQFRTLILDVQLMGQRKLPVSVALSVAGPDRLRPPAGQEKKPAGGHDDFDFSGNPLVLENSASTPGVRARLLGFARTRSTPGIRVGDDGRVSIYFRGNGKRLTSVGGYADLSGETAVHDDDYYQEGTHAREFMSEGSFFLCDYRTGDDAGRFEGLTELTAARPIDSPPPPRGFVWLVPPSFKVTGICQFLAAMDRNDILDKGDEVASGALVDDLEHRVVHIVGRGTFGEGIYKPFLTVPIETRHLDKITTLVKAKASKAVLDRVPDPGDDERKQAIHRHPPPAEADLYGLADLVCAERLAATEYWKGKVDKEAVHTKFADTVSGEQHYRRLRAYHQEVASREIKDLSRRIRAFRSYGDVAGAIAGFITNEDLTEKLLQMSGEERNAIIHEELRKLAVLDPSLASVTGGVIAAHGMYTQAVNDPLSILLADDVDETLTKQALTEVISAIVEKKSGDEDAEEVMALAGITGAEHVGAFVDEFFYARLKGVKKLIPPRTVRVARYSPEYAQQISENQEGRLSAQLRLNKMNVDYLRASRVVSMISTVASIFVMYKLGKGGLDTDKERGEFVAAALGAVSVTPSYFEGARWIARRFKLARSGARAGTRVAVTGATISAAAVDEVAAAAGVEVAANAVEEVTKLSKVLRFCEYLGPVAEAIAAGFSIAKLVHDVKGHEDDWTVGLDITGVAVAGAGTVAAVALVAEASWAPPVAVVVAVVAIAVTIAECVHADDLAKEAERRRLAHKKARHDWIAWGREVLDRPGVRISASNDLISTGFRNGALARGNDLRGAGHAGMDQRYEVWDGKSFSYRNQPYEQITARVRDPVAGFWVAENERSRWLDVSVGTSTFVTYFIVNESRDVGTFKIRGLWAADNTAKMYLNDRVISTITDNTFGEFTDFSITQDDGLVPGRNHLYFEVLNYAGSGGLRVEILDA